MYKEVSKSFGRYWEAYGGAKSLRHSPYLHFSLLVTIGLTPIWLKENWWDKPLAILPNLVGFTLGGYAILMAFGDERFRSAIAGATAEGKPSPFVVLSATFMHFILLQAGALILALVASTRPVTGLFDLFALKDIHETLNKSYPYIFLSRAFWFFGFFLFLYSLATAVAATVAIFNLSIWYDKAATKRNQ